MLDWRNLKTTAPSSNQFESLTAIKVRQGAMNPDPGEMNINSFQFIRSNGIILIHCPSKSFYRDFIFFTHVTLSQMTAVIVAGE